MPPRPDVLDRLAQRGGDGRAETLSRDAARSRRTILQDAAAAGDADSRALRSRVAPISITTMIAIARVARRNRRSAHAGAQRGGAARAPRILSAPCRARANDAELARALVARLPHRPEILALFMSADARQRALMIAARARKRRRNRAAS